MKLPRLVGVAGTNGSGKDTLGDVLSQHSGYKVVSLSDILRNELDKRGMEHSRKNLSGLSQEIRSNEGQGSMSKRAIAANQDIARLCITSIRSPGEVEVIQAAGGKVIWIDADPRIRYQRISSRSGSRPEDVVSFEEFIEHEDAEMNPSEQGGGLNMSAVKAKADEIILNEFDSLDSYSSFLCEHFEIEPQNTQS